VDQGIVVDELHGTGGEEGLSGVFAHRFTGGKEEEGTESFAAAQDGISHGLVNLARRRGDGRKKARQCLLN